VCLFICSCEEASSYNYSERNKYIDESYKKINDKYLKLCGRPRNDYLKSEFEELRTEIAEVRYMSEKLVNIDYEKKIEISEYCENRLKSYPSLLKLANYSIIDCWRIKD
jgi:hypothetical protein